MKHLSISILFLSFFSFSTYAQSSTAALAELIDQMPPSVQGVAMQKAQAMRMSGMTTDQILHDLPQQIDQRTQMQKDVDHENHLFQVYTDYCDKKFPELDSAFKQRLWGEDFDAKSLIAHTPTPLEDVRQCLSLAAEFSKAELERATYSEQAEAMRTTLRDFFTALNASSSDQSLVRAASDDVKNVAR